MQVGRNEIRVSKAELGRYLARVERRQCATIINTYTHLLRYAQNDEGKSAGYNEGLDLAKSVHILNRFHAFSSATKLASLIENHASDEARRMSVAHTRSTPPPTHAECTADITGFGHLAQADRRVGDEIKIYVAQRAMRS